MENSEEKVTKSGFVALVGRPNVGKSTFLNKLIGQKIAIVSPKVQTTRTKILGVYTYPQKDAQVVFVDLPGIHKPVDELGKTCLKISLDGANEADLIIFMSEANHSPGQGDAWIVDWIKKHCPQIPLLVVLNKADLAKRQDRLKRDIVDYEALFEHFEKKPTIMSISTLDGTGLEELLQKIHLELSEGPFYFPDDAPTNRSLRFLASELIREQVLLQTDEEVPHSCAVTIESYEEVAEPREMVKIKAFILVETESQKGILVGKKGSKIKEIGTKARLEIEELVGSKVFLDLKIKVSPKWRRNNKVLNSLGLMEE
ncbi:MAG: GTPase Era [Candidatus Caenarcaniphilales bacterium]|nr:GTPase Era [Candidatus Caenarcaniphilales bacterium]